MLEAVAICDLCGGRDFAPRAVFPEYLLFTGERFRLVRCRGCSLCFLDPRPGREAIGRYYPEDYFAHQGAQPAPLRPWQRRTEREAELGLLGRAWLRMCEDVAWYALPRPRGERRILDLGAGSGKLLDVMRQLGWHTTAVDPSAGAVERARVKGHDGVVGYAEDRLFDDASFDVVYLWHALEHAHSPGRVLERVRRYLRPGGALVLAVPNYGSAQARLFGRWWWSTDAPRHLYQFDRATLGRYLAGAGFGKVRMTTRTGATSWVRGVRHVVNGLFRTRLQNDPAWLVGAAELLVVLGSLVRFFGVGSELRVVAEP